MNAALPLLSASVLLISCAPQTRSLAKDAPGSMQAPPAYLAASPPAPEIADRLLELFDHPPLESAVKQALTSNPDLRRSFARLEEAGFETRRARAPRFPTLVANTTAARSGGPGRPESALLDASLDANWEVDVWGRIRSGVVARAADEAAAAADYTAARQSIAAQTMQAWFDLAAAEALVELTRRRVASFEQTERSVERRRLQGTTTLADLELTRSDTNVARADLEARQDDRDRAARALAVLTGSYPTAALSTGGSWPTLRRGVPAGLPSELLRHRPDIEAAYQRLRASDARVQVAHRDLFPRFQLTASGGQSSNVLSDLARSGFSSWSVLAGLSQPLFAGGERRAELGAAGKRAEQSYYSYRNIVLQAFREVEDALAGERYLESEQAARQQALASARSAESRTRRDFEAGLTELLNLLVAQRQVFSTEERTIVLRTARLKNRVSLALALGKGV